MSPERATLLHSPGWNEGKARYETLGTHKTKSYMSSFRSGTTARTFASCRCGGGQSSAAPTGLNKYTITNNPGLAPWALKKYRPPWGSSTPYPNPFVLFDALALPQLRQKTKNISRS